ncbi:REP-associated tyrosine transposase [Gilvimarinus sp. F26214L]|uniref:REP-associated tyrosine transposase n=1 Tax=Gilvimarinus sp. DZF01 TaxID=3461371 RepID=UPI004045FD86
MEYRRNFTPGGSYFFTTVTYERRPVLTRWDSVEVLRWAFRRVMARFPFTLDAIVILPDHLHSIWTLPAGDSDYATRWRLIKTAFTRSCDSRLHSRVSSNRVARRERAIWQRRYWEHTLMSEEDLRAHRDYLHYNPVKHGLVEAVKDWPYSTFHRFVQRGMYPLDWGGAEVELRGVGGE